MPLKKTQMLIIESLLGLMKKKHYDSISVAEITRNALVARNSFYRNFSSKDEILNVHIRQLIELYDRSLEVRMKFALLSPNLMARVFFPFFRTHSDFLLEIQRNNLTALLIDEFAIYLDSVLHKNKNDASVPRRSHHSELCYYLMFHSAGLCQVLLYWLKGGCLESETEMAGILSSVVSSN